MTENILSSQKKYFDKRNSIFNRIEENIQKINLIKLSDIGFNERLLIEHLSKENDILKSLF